jgi:hypothetical protein
MAEYGYRNSVIMQDLLKKTKEDPSKEQKEVIKNCINNYVFFLSSRGEQADNEHVAEACPELEKIILEGQTIPRWYDYVDTLAWANLHLNRNDATKTTEKLLELVNDSGLSIWWKKAAIERYKLYNKVHPDKDKVDVETLKQKLPPEATPPSPGAGTPGPEAAPLGPGAATPGPEAAPPGSGAGTPGLKLHLPHLLSSLLSKREMVAMAAVGWAPRTGQTCPLTLSYFPPSNFRKLADTPNKPVASYM